MKKITYLLSIIVLSAVIMISCDDFLGEEIVSGVTADVHYTSPEGFEDAVRASYSRLRGMYGMGEAMLALTEMGTDISSRGGHGGYHYMNTYDAEHNSEQWIFQNLWDNAYQGINTTNAVIARSGDLEDIDQNHLNSRLAEVRFIRAQYYFALVQHFGPVHLTLEETIGVETEAERVEESVIYEAIVDDLEYAIDHLPPSQSDFGRVTRPAAKHMLSLVLLTRGQTDFAGNNDLQRAADLAIDVIENYDHQLLDDPADVFDHDNEGHDEVIWAVSYGNDPLFASGNNTHLYYRPWYEVYHDGLSRALEPGYGRPWIRVRPTTFGMENYRPLDVDARYSSWFQDVWYYNDEGGLVDGAALGDTALWVHSEHLSQADVDEISNRLPGVNVMTWHPDNAGDDWYWDINIFPNLKKVDDFKRPSINEVDGTRDWIVYRLAETYLNAAEALLLQGNAPEAVNYVNAVRRRAAYPGQENEMEISAGELDMDFLLDERGREFYGEQKRWMDLKRTGTLVDRVRSYNFVVSSPGDTFDVPHGSDNIQEHHTLRPIPATQRTRTTNDYPQNPDY